MRAMPGLKSMSQFDAPYGERTQRQNLAWLLGETLHLSVRRRGSESETSPLMHLDGMSRFETEEGISRALQIRCNTCSALLQLCCNSSAFYTQTHQKSPRIETQKA
jgi:hypothetical protein